MKKQKIEDIFSSIENFSSVPPPELWSKIEEELDKPKKKKRVVLWWSAAACLLLGLLLPSVLHFTSDSGNKTIHNETVESSVVLDENKKDSNNSKTISIKDDIVEKETVVAESSAEGNTVNPSANVQNNKAKASDNKINPSVINEVNPAQAVAEKTLSTQKQNSFNSLSNNQLPNSVRGNENQAVAQTVFDTEKQSTTNSFSNNSIPNSVLEEKTTSKNAAVIALNPSNSAEKNNSLSKEQVLTETINSKTTLAELTQKSNNVLSKQDSIQLVQLQNLEKGIAEAEPKKEKETTPISNDEKWSLEVFAGIANSENYGKQKTLGNLNESKQTNSYGVKTNYKLNKKWAVSSGLKLNELGQSIANVSYYSSHEAASIPSAPLTNDHFQSSSTLIAPKITDNSGYVFVSKSTQNTLKSDNVESGNIDQSLKYIEMPLEVSYSLFSKNKTNISLNTGGFVGKLISNDVTLNGNSIGDNLNANDFVYGSLLSSTFQYQLYKKTHVFVEPGMNYYINPLNNQTFNQFQWSFNFGLNVSF